MEKSLLIGCGNDRRKKVAFAGQEAWTGELVTLDMNPNCGADIIMDCSRIAWQAHPTTLYRSRVLPFLDEEIAEIGAYDVLEHWGTQGDWRGWFTEMAEYHRVLKPGGTMGILVPTGEDALADPGHTRFFSGNHFLMLNQQFYADSLAKDSPITDYRWYWTLNFEVAYLRFIGSHHIAVILRKPE